MDMLLGAHIIVAGTDICACNPMLRFQTYGMENRLATGAKRTKHCTWKVFKGRRLQCVCTHTRVVPGKNFPSHCYASAAAWPIPKDFDGSDRS